MITQTERNNLIALCYDRCPYNINNACRMFEEYGFEFYCMERYFETGNISSVSFQYKGILVQIVPNTYFGCTINILKDEHNILN